MCYSCTSRTLAPIPPAVDTATEVNAVVVYPSATTVITSLATSTPSISSSPANLYTVFLVISFFLLIYLK